MLENFIRKYVSNAMNGENDTSFAMAGKTIADSYVIPEMNIDDLIGEMTLDEKIDMLGGRDNLAVRGLPRLNIPDVWCTDASAGVRCFGRSTAFPIPLALAATWSRDLQRKTGEAIGEECRAKGVSVLLGPGINIYRVPTNGRNFEYMGEDPYLAAELVVPYIQGVQSRGVITTVKHFAVNNSDYDRHRMDSKVDERTLQEIYFPAFKAAVQRGKSKSVMCSYNPVNGIYASENRYLLTEILRDQWGFNGFVISDWTCVYSSEGPVQSGLDLEMPYGKFMNRKKLLPLLNKGDISEKQIDDKVRNLMKTFFEIGAYSRPVKDSSFDEYSREHSLISLEGAREAIVLLKNENNILPLDRIKIRKIALVGFNAVNTTTCGGGSCCVQSYDKVNIIDGIRTLGGDGLQVDCIASVKGIHKLSKYEKQILTDAHIVLFCAGFSHVEESECYDRTWELPFGQDKLIKEICYLNPRTVVLLSAGGGVETQSWLHNVPALLHTFYLGENTGTAIAEVLFGEVNPSGKLPFTMAKKWSDFASTAHYVKHPGKISIMRILGPQGTTLLRKPWTLEYGEKLMVGYRHFDTADIEPQFPFGFGLSYTSFELSDFSLSSEEFTGGSTLQVSFNVTNRGEFSGADVIQLYIRDLESSLIRPEKELKGFEKVYLQPGESKEVLFVVNEEMLMFFHEGTNRWTAETGFFTLLIGNSSRHIQKEVQVQYTSS
jgi:beta-glucosidase